jgi:hypothetical protein
MKTADKISEGNIWLTRIRRARLYEDAYRNQAYVAYKLYNKNYEDFQRTDFEVGEKVERLYSGKHFTKANRSNIFYANIETLLSLVLPDVPSVKVDLKSKYSTSTEDKNQKFYDLAINVLQESSRYFIKSSLKKSTFKKFKLDHFITGRGVLWVDNTTNLVQDKFVQSIDIDYVHWLNFAMDPKLEWADVRWVARRRFVNKAKLKSLYPDVDFEDFNFTENPWTSLDDTEYISEIVTTYISNGSKYAEVWEIWDKHTSNRIIVSEQSDKKIVSISKIENVADKYFFPTPEPPLSIMNGLDLRPTSEVWSYLHELKQLSYISVRKEQLLRSLLLKGFTAASNREVLNSINKSKDGDIISVPNLDPQYPNVIAYIDNRPKVELLNTLGVEHENLKKIIYEVTGISDQMRNVTAVPDNQTDETATAIRAKTVFGSRRLREKQDILISYLREIYELIIFRVCSIIEKDTLSDITNVDISDSNMEEINEYTAKFSQYNTILQQLNQRAQEMQASGDMQNLQTLKTQIESLEKEMDSTQKELDKVKDEPTWENIIMFFRGSALNAINIDVELDDMNNVLERSQLGQKYITDNNTLMNAMVQIIQLSLQYPDYVEIFTNILASSTDTSIYSLSQKRELQNFVMTLREKIEQIRENPAPPPPPTPEQIKAQAAQTAAQAKMTEAQARAQLDTAKVGETQASAQSLVMQAQAKMAETQIKAQSLQGQGQNPQDVNDNSKEILKANIESQKESARHARELEKLKMQLASQDNATKDKIASDTNLMKLKMKADQKRHQEKLNNDILKEQLKVQATQKRHQDKLNHDYLKEHTKHENKINEKIIEKLIDSQNSDIEDIEDTEEY